MNTGKAMLWLPTRREEKYRAKQAIDTFFVRFGDVLATVVVAVAVSLLHLPAEVLAMVNAILCMLWILVVWRVARRHRTLSADKQVPERAPLVSPLRALKAALVLALLFLPSCSLVPVRRGDVVHSSRAVLCNDPTLDPRSLSCKTLSKR
jgi:hypothetical protein